ncbi:MAG: hypothetical protein ABIV50_09805 [Opitutus sp.]
MSTSVDSPVAPRSLHLWRWLLGGFALCCVAITLVVINLVTLSSDASALRKGLSSSLTTGYHTRVQVSVGPVFLSAVRAGLSFSDDIPAEARLALRGIERASVGVYELNHELTAEGGTRMFAAADDLMERRGWTRVVGVKDRATVVLVYVPQNQTSSPTERVCVAVCDTRNLIVVSGNLRFEPLVQLALHQHLLASR